MWGPITNSACIIIGAVVGAVCARVLRPELRRKFNLIFGCIAMGIGVSMTSRGNALPPVVISILFGAMLGELFRIESGVMRLAFRCSVLFHRKTSDASLPERAFRDQFAVATVLFCVSGLGIMGAMREGMTGDPSLLFIKSLLDLFTAMLFAANIGGIVGVLALPQLLTQMVILLSATALAPLTTPALLADFTACGGIIMLGAALTQLGLVQVPLLSMLPALFLVMPISALWARFFSV